MPLDNALVLGNLCEDRHKRYIAKTRFFALHFCHRKYRCIFNHFYVIGPESYRMRHNNGHYAVQGPRLFKVTDFGTNRKLICDFLLVINSNLHRIWHRFQVMAHHGVKFSLATVDGLTLTPSLGVIPCEFPDDLYLSTN